MGIEQKTGGPPSLDLNVPLLLDQNQSKLKDLEASDDDEANFIGTTSFSKTCFNGLNALTGIVSFLFSFFFFSSMNHSLPFLSSHNVLYVYGRNWDIINPICSSIRRMDKFNSPFHHCHCNILFRFIDSKMHGLGS